MNPHAPAAQFVVALARAGHTLPHAPQLVTLVLTFTSQPLLGTPSQFAKPALHADTAQNPAAQPAVALGSTQVLPQLPQDVTEDCRLVSQPSAALVLQSPKPALQAAMPHAPPTQAPLALANVQAAPQRAQSLALVLTFTSQPLPAMPSQFA